MFNSILGTNLTLINFIICIASAFILGLIVAFMHMKTSRSNSNFTTTLAVLPILVTMVILLVNGNLGTSVAIVGAFSLVRFRSIPGNSREILDVFFAMAIGLAVGTGYIAFAALFTIVVSIITWLLTLVKFGENQTKEKILTILVPEELDYTNVFDDIFEEYVKTSQLVKAKTTNMGSLFELKYNLKLKDGVNEKEFVDKLRVRNGNLKIVLSHPMLGEEL